MCEFNELSINIINRIVILNLVWFLLLQQFQYKCYRSKESEIELFCFWTKKCNCPLIQDERSLIAPDVLIRQLNQVQIKPNYSTWTS